MTLKELLNEWLNENHYSVIKPRTYLRYECSIRTNINPYIGNIDIESLTARDIQHFLNESKYRKSVKSNKYLSNCSLNLIILILKMAYRYAIDFDLLKINPLEKIKMFPISKIAEIKTFTKEEQIKIERYIESLHNNEYFVYILTLYTGLRLGEVWR